MIGDYQDYSIIKIGQNTEKSPGDLRKLVNQTPVKDDQLTLLWKTLKQVIRTRWFGSKYSDVILKFANIYMVLNISKNLYIQLHLLSNITNTHNFNTVISFQVNIPIL